MAPVPTKKKKRKKPRPYRIRPRPPALPPMHMFVWDDNSEEAFAVAQAESVAVGRELVLAEIKEQPWEEPTRRRTSRWVRTVAPVIWKGRNAEAVLRVNGTVADLEAECDRHVAKQEELMEAVRESREQIDALKEIVLALRLGLRRAMPFVADARREKVSDDYGKEDTKIAVLEACQQALSRARKKHFGLEKEKENGK